MTVKVWKNFSKRRNSTKRPSDSSATTLTVHLKEDTSTESPVFVVSGYDPDINYLQFGSDMYFVTDVVCLTNNQSELHCSTDPLGTARGYIGAYEGYVLRSSHDFNENVADSFYPVTADIQTNSVSSVDNPWKLNLSEGRYVLGVISPSQQTVGAVTYYGMTKDEMSTFMGKLMDPAAAKIYSGMASLTDILWAQELASYNPMQYVVSCKWFPFLWNDLIEGSFNVHVGWWDISMTAGRFKNTSELAYTKHIELVVPKHPQIEGRGNYMGTSKYSTYTLSFYPFGNIDLPADLLLYEEKIHLYITVDMITGMGKLVVTGNASNIIANAYAPVGIDIPLAQLTNNALSQVGGVIGSTIGAMANAALAHPVGLLSNMYSAVVSVNNLGIPNVSKNGSAGGFTGLSQDFENDISLYCTFYHIADEDNTHIGRPLCEVRKISDIPGYIQCSNASIQFPGRIGDIDAVNSFMNNGFYYE